VEEEVYTVTILIFRLCLVLAFLVAAVKWADWKNRAKYYPTILFVMVVNLAASFLTYHHILWNYNPDAMVKSQTIIELVNSFFMLPVTTFIYLSKMSACPSKRSQFNHIVFWILLYACLEFIDHYIVGGISYKNGWSWPASAIFDIAMFSIIWLHYLRPFAAWTISFAMTAAIILIFNFMSGEFK
jgi:hypothetical protein